MTGILLIAVFTSACLALMKAYTWFYYTIIVLAGVFAVLSLIGAIVGGKDDR